MIWVTKFFSRGFIFWRVSLLRRHYYVIKTFVPLMNRDLKLTLSLITMTNKTKWHAFNN